MMKPKSSGPNDEGLLEYLEEIVGSCQYVARIEEGAKKCVHPAPRGAGAARPPPTHTRSRAPRHSLSLCCAIALLFCFVFVFV